MDWYFSELSKPNQRLLRVIQELRSGVIELLIRGGQPSFNPPSKIIQEVELGIEVIFPSDEDDFVIRGQ